MNESDCTRIFAVLSEYLDRELPAGACHELEQHLKDCPPCIQFVNSLKRSIGLCRQYGEYRSPARISPNVLDGLRAAYDSLISRRRGRQ